MRRWLAAAPLVLLAAVGCEDDLPRASEIEHMRVLGAKTEVIGEESRSSPRPGERAELIWDMAFPDPMQDDSELSSLFVTCTAPNQFTGVPVCQEEIDFAKSRPKGEQVADDPMLPSVPINCADTPEIELALGPFSGACVQGTPRQVVSIEPGFKGAGKLVRGIICRNAAPLISTDQPGGLVCSRRGDAAVESIPVYGTIKVEQSEADANLNPSVDAARILFGENELPWLPVSEDDEAAYDENDCKQAAQDQILPSTNGKDEKITIEYDASQRERVDGVPEDLEISTYITFGRLTRRFTVFEGDAKLPLSSEFRWDVKQELRDELGDGSRLVRFWFTLLDRRGGYALTHRDLCVGRDLTGP